MQVYRWVGGCVLVGIVAVGVIGWWPRAEDPKSGFIKQAEERPKDKVIVFVHGVTGNSTDTWTNRTSGTYWPRMVAEDPLFAGADVYALDYSRALSIPELTTNIKGQLERDGVLAYRKLIFVSHSQGGVVVRKMLLRWRDQIDLSRVMFLYDLAVPIGGERKAFVGLVLWQSLQFRSLWWMSDPESQREFEANWRVAARGLKSFCAYETRPMYGLKTIVERDNAVKLCSEGEQGMDADHLSIAKPLSTKSDTYAGLASAYNELNAFAVSKHIEAGHDFRDAAEGLKGPGAQAELLRAIGEYEQAKRDLDRDQQWYSWVYAVLGLAEAQLSLWYEDPEAPRAFLKAAETNYREILEAGYAIDAESASRLYMELGETLLLQGDQGWTKTGRKNLEEARGLLEKAVALQRAGYVACSCAHSEGLLADTLFALAKGEEGEAKRELLRQAVKLNETSLGRLGRDDPGGRAEAAWRLGLTLRDLGRLNVDKNNGEARKQLERALGYLRSANGYYSRKEDPVTWVFLQSEIGNTFGVLGYASEGMAAVDNFGKAVRYYRGGKSAAGIGKDSEIAVAQLSFGIGWFEAEIGRATKDQGRVERGLEDLRFAARSIEKVHGIESARPVWDMAAEVQSWMGAAMPLPIKKPAQPTREATPEVAKPVLTAPKPVPAKRITRRGQQRKGLFDFF